MLKDDDNDGKNNKYQNMLMGWGWKGTILCVFMSISVVVLETKGKSHMNTLDGLGNPTRKDKINGTFDDCEFMWNSKGNDFGWRQQS